MVALALSLTGSGCGPTVTSLHQEPGFVYTTLSQDGIAAIGATTAVGTWDQRLARRDPLTKGLEGALREERKDLRILAAADVRSAMGEEAYADMMDGFDRSGEMSESELSVLGSLLADRARYAALARVEDSSVSKDEATDYSNPDEPKTTFTTTRTVRVAFRIYDLQSGKSVWNATLKKSKNNASTHTEEESGGFFEELVESVLGLNDDPEHPDAPTSASILGDIFAKFAKELPQSK